MRGSALAASITLDWFLALFAVTALAIAVLYGTIGVVFALLAWLLVFGRMVVYDVIIEARFWERTHGDQRVELEVPALPGR